MTRGRKSGARKGQEKVLLYAKCRRRPEVGGGCGEVSECRRAVPTNGRTDTKERRKELSDSRPCVVRARGLVFSRC